MRSSPVFLCVCLSSLVLSSGVWPAAAAGTARLVHRTDAREKARDADELDRLERAAFTDLWEHRDRQSGLVYNTTEANAPASPAACGVALCAIPLGIERGWIHRAEGYERAKQLLQSLQRAEQVHGFFYHFLDPRHGTRTWQSEVSCIDSSILFAGAMVVAEYFQGTELERLANQLIDRAEWPWFLDGEDTLKWSWKPETGFEGGSMDFSESILAYLLALGSSTHPIPSASWQALRRPITRVLDGTTSMVYTHDGALFAYLLPLVWFDLRDQHDAFLDYWTNANTAIRSNQAFAFNQRAQFATYREGLWGVSAALGPDGYRAYGAPPAIHAVHDGTVAPHTVMAALPWFPDLALETLRRMERVSPAIWTPYGFGDALNLDRHFASPYTIALDQGMGLFMIENARTGLIWRLMMQHPVAQHALKAAGFVAGALSEPLVPAIVPGNPGASLMVPMIDHAVTIDGDLSEWIHQEAIELSPTNRRNVESGFFKSAQDASALLYLGWTPAMFYVAGIVVDDELVTRRQREQIYQDDCLELYWDMDQDGFQFDDNPHDIQLGLAPGGGPDGAWQVWAWGALKRAPEQVQSAVVRQPGRFLFELGIPLTLLSGLQADHPVRFSVSYHDRDTDGKSGKLHWSIDTASHPGTILFGSLTLTGRSRERVMAEPSASVQETTATVASREQEMSTTVSP